MNALRIIEDAFNHRRMPTVFLVSEQLATHERMDVMSFWGQPWPSLTGAQLEKHFEAVFWFTPEAFCYYLPGIFSTGIKENKPSLIVNGSLLNMLDRSADPLSWDDFFSARWPCLTSSECEATQAWILWLASVQSNLYSEASLDRALDTLELLRRRASERSEGGESL